MQEHTPEEEGVGSEKMKQWLQDNLRIIVSIAIVVAIAGGIYSYSKRAESPIVTDETALESSEQAAQEGTEAVEVSEEKTSAEPKEQVASIATSQETESSFVETAMRGDGVTHLARRATANYLEKNPDSSLTKEHKIYIEDYLRKKVGRSQTLHPGDSVEFSKDMVREAIDQSKQLNEKQLQNLKQYSARVTSLS
ncbi:MAG TPA: hypothetical protein PKA31_02470 [Candidatus Moranbacteria bacterium]|nr:hypothetical protein [Candidatus Moranbacteria bacterium]